MGYQPRVQGTKKAREGFCTFLNYVGGAYIYVRLKFTDRLKILASSWATANNKMLLLSDEEVGDGDEEGAQKKAEEAEASGEVQEQAAFTQAQGEEKATGKKKQKVNTSWFGQKAKSTSNSM